LAQAEERTARQNQGEVHLRERVSDVERREVMLQQQLASAKAESAQARTRLTLVERDLASAKTTLEDADARRERQKVRFDALMREARDAVASAAKRQSQMEDADKEIISDLLKQVQDLRLRTGTNG
jgi:F0F1-type ATP synthase membrane subunit b/b'